MIIQITPKLLGDISKDISSGRAIWGMLRANEYMAPGSPIRLALAKKAKAGLLGSPKSISTIYEAIESGAKLSELSINEREFIYSLNEPKRSYRKFPKIINNRKRSSRRVPSRALRMRRYEKPFLQAQAVAHKLESVQ